MERKQAPLNLTQKELLFFNDYWKTLDPTDRQVLDEILTNATGDHPVVDPNGRPIPYQTYLLSLLIEEHKEVIRLRRALEEARKRKHPATQRAQLPS